jgi:hypothetical protein
MLEKMAMLGSDRRRNERPPVLTQGHMPSSNFSLCSAANPGRALRAHTLPSSRDFLARFLLDTQCPSGCRSTRHSDTSRNGSNFFHPIKTASATRHLNATLVTRHSSAKIEPVLPSLFFSSDMANGGPGGMKKLIAREPGGKNSRARKSEQRYEMSAVGLVTAMRRTSDLEKPASSIFCANIAKPSDTGGLMGWPRSVERITRSGPTRRTLSK